MIENIYVYLILLKSKFIQYDEYNVLLDGLFLEHSDNELLIELEYLSYNENKSWDYFHQYCFEHKFKFDYIVFGKCLFEFLEHIYRKEKYDIKEFANKGYQVWLYIPQNYYERDPFWILNHADDYVSIGQVEEAKVLYEKAFVFYRTKDMENMSMEDTNELVKTNIQKFD